MLVLASFFCLVGTSTAMAQVARPFNQPTQAKYYAPIDSRPTVSPYLNLTNNNVGLSNYQTLVRPLIEEREELIGSGVRWSNSISK